MRHFQKEGKSSYGMAMYFYNSLAFADVVLDAGVILQKKAETCTISATMQKVKDFGLLRNHIFLDAMEVINAIKRAKDWVINNLVEDILDVLCSLRKLSFLVSRKLNRAAFCLAKFGSKKRKNFEWVGFFSD